MAIDLANADTAIGIAAVAALICLPRSGRCDMAVLATNSGAGPAAFYKNAKSPNMLARTDAAFSKFSCDYMTDSIRYIVGVNESSISVIKMGG